MSDDTEQVRVLNEDGTPTGEYVSKTEIIKRGVWRPVVHVWLVSNRGQTLMHRRTKTVKRWPGLKDVSVGEGVQGDEEFAAAAVRGLEEELGLSVDTSQLKHVGEFRLEHDLPGGIITKEVDHTFAVEFSGDISDLTPDGQEIDEAFWVSFDELEEQIKNDDEYAKFINHGKDYYLEVLKWLRAN